MKMSGLCQVEMSGSADVLRAASPGEPGVDLRGVLGVVGF
jgi:hypothetical protein